MCKNILKVKKLKIANILLSTNTSVAENEIKNCIKEIHLNTAGMAQDFMKSLKE